MSLAMAGKVSPGWYPDPAGGNGQRYWDGKAWGPVAPGQPPAKGSPKAMGCLFSVIGVVLFFGGCTALFAAGSSDDHKTTSSSSGGSGYTPRATAPTSRHLSDDEINEGSFIGTLDMFSVPYGSRSDAISQAKALCLWYQANDAFFEAGAMQIMKENAAFSADDAGHFAGAATAVYCPQYGPKKN